MLSANTTTVSYQCRAIILFLIFRPGRNDLKKAAVYFEAAVRSGSPFEAYYYLADIQSRIARNPSTPTEIAGSACAVAVSFNKLVAERGLWGDNLLQEAEIAWNTGTDHGKELAMLNWWIAAERGFEVAQNNIAFVLDQGTHVFSYYTLNSPRMIAFA